MRRIGPLLMSTVLVAGCAGVATNAESLSVLLERSGQSQPKLSAYEQGKRHLQFKSPGLAVVAFEQAFKEHPDSVAALNGLAVAYDRLGRADVAQRYLDRALTLDANSAVTLNNLAYLNLVQGNTAVALAYAERAKIAVDMPMDMMLPDTIANAIDRTAEIASKVAINETMERQVAQTPPLPPESDIKQVGLNEWQLRIRPPNPADAVRINLPARNTAPRVIEPMARAVVPPIYSDPLTEAVMVSDIPQSVMDDLMAPPSEPSPAEIVVAALPQGVMSEPVVVGPAPQPVESVPAPVISEPTAEILSLPAPMPEFRAPTADAITAMPPVIALVPSQPLPEPAREEPTVVAVLPEPAPPPQFGSPAAEAAMPELVPPQPLPEPVGEEPMVAALPPPEPLLSSLAAEAIAATPPVITVVPAQPLPERVREEPMVAALPPPEPLSQLRSLAAEAIVATPPVITVVPAQPSPEPVREEPAPAVALMPSEPPAEAARLQQLMASLAVPAPQTAVPLAPAREADIGSPAAETPKPTPPAARLVAPMVASVAPSWREALPSTSPTPLASDWRASVPSSTMVRVSNGTGRRLMATRFARYFGDHGLSVRKIANANSYDYRRTVIFYNPDQRAQAEALAAVLPFPVKLAEAKQSRGQIELILGFDLLGLDDSLRSA